MVLADAGLARSAEAPAADGFDVAVEASGVPSPLGQALDLLRRGGTAVQVGTLPPAVTLPLDAVMAREPSLVGSFRFAGAFGTAPRLIGSRAGRRRRHLRASPGRRGGGDAERAGQGRSGQVQVEP